MSDYEDAGSETGFRRLIREAKEEAFKARQHLRRDQLQHDRPGASVEAKANTAIALADYRDVLYDYHDEGALKTPWDKRDVDIDLLDDYLAGTTTGEKELPRRGSPTVSEPVPKVKDAPVDYLFQVGKELDAIAKELGFAASARDKTPSDEASMDDLRGLLKARGQTEALRNLPGGDEEADKLEEAGAL